MSRIFLYRLKGEYWGYIYKNRIFNYLNIYKGWIEDNKYIWDFRGNFLGELIDGTYILKNTNEVSLINKIPLQEIQVNFIINKRKNKIARKPIKGWVDILKNDGNL